MNKDNNSKIKSVLIIVLTVLISFLATTWLCTFYFTKTGEGLKKVVGTQTKKLENISLQDNLKIVKNILKSTYIGDLDEETMNEAAIKGYVSGLDDPYTEYLTKDEYEDLMTSVNGDYVGIGVYMTETNDKQIIVLMPIEGSPAEEVGIKSGDIILKANGEELTGLGTDIAVTKIKGEEGTTVELEILRKDETINFTVERRKIELKTIDSKMLDDNIGYIQFITFDEGCTADLMEHYNKLKDQGMKSLIIDIRDNGGGLVDEVIEMADEFIEKDKIIMKTIDKAGKEEINYSEKEPSIKDIDVVLLINENSASASEILAGALQDNQVVQIVGTTTYGKGVMQSLSKFGKGALKITIEEFRTPNGNVINKEGITPDVEIEDDEKTAEDEQLNKAIELIKK